MDRRAVVLLLTVALAAVAGLAYVMLQDGGPDPEPDRYPLPEGFSLDASTGFLSYRSDIDWSVFDEFHTYLNPDMSVYEAETSTGRSVQLHPGLYTVAAAGERFAVLCPGEISSTSHTWSFFRDGVTHDGLALTVTIDAGDLADIILESREWNTFKRTTRTPGAILKNNSYMFSDLPTRVVVDDTVRSVLSSLTDMYVGMGYDMDDRQAFADFIASFAQLGVEYPPSVTGHRSDYDYYQWGLVEYWASPAETLYFMMGDCEDTSILFASLCEAAGYRTAVGGYSGHVFAGVAVDGFEEWDSEDVYAITGSTMVPLSRPGCTGDPDTEYLFVETTKKYQIPVGYTYSGTGNMFGKDTDWGTSGFYSVV